MKYRSLRCALSPVALNNNTVFVRADLNVPLQNGAIVNDFRLQRSTTTLNYIIDHNGTIVLATHLGRPNGFDPAYSTRHLISWFAQRNYTITYAHNPDEAVILAQQRNHDIVLLENVRFFPQEKTQRESFAHVLAASADYYVNDAWGLMHRSDTSITTLPTLFTADHTSIGYLVEDELIHLDPLIHTIKRPYVFILGGAKIETKLPLIERLLDNVDTILLCPPLVFTFMAAQGKSIGRSLIKESLIETAQTILNKAAQSATELAFAHDYQVAHKTFAGPLSIRAANDFSADDVGIAIGPKTIAQYHDIIQNAQTVFFNGMMGFLDKPKTLHATQELFNSIAQSDAYSVIAGGDTVAAALTLTTVAHNTFLSTGGGATLAYIAGQDLPGLDTFVHENGQ